ncbi:MAG TPA: ABC transporter permease [Candidatus Gallimonas intestinavium]|uniref:ABC transporter permease n=1 Tax=Candidatus Gallimonas intestinavium TaxID=2838603 RepID=A0A9D2G494_9FIRM|nr:ABC transporter permease [Candidatus Gallimonas intestinavium]
METTFRRAKLSLWSAVRIGSHGMLQKPVRLLIVLFLTAVALILFGLSVTVAMYDEDRAIAESMVLYDRATLVKKPDGSAFSKEELALLEKRTGKAFGTLSPAPLELLPDLMLFSAGENKSLGDLTHCITKSPDGMIVLSEAVLGEAEGYTLTGRLPEGTAEIALPACLAQLFVELNYYDEIASPQVYHEDNFTWEYDEAHLTRISSHEELIGEKLYLADPAGGEPLQASIVGILEYECGREGYHNASDMSLTLEDQLIVSEEYAKAAFGGSTGMFALAGPPESASEAATLYELLKSGEYLVYTDAVAEVEEYRETIGGFTGAFVGVGAAFAVFAGALIFQFINLSIEAKRGQVGILRALGARSYDVCRIFFSESFLLALVSVAVAIPSTVGLSYAVNKILADLFFIRIAVLNFTIWMPVSILLLGFVIAFAATVFPVLKEARKAPIDAIRDAA